MEPIEFGGSTLIVALGIILVLIPPDPFAALMGYVFVVGGLSILGFLGYRARKRRLDD